MRYHNINIDFIHKLHCIRRNIEHYKYYIHTLRIIIVDSQQYK